VKAEEGYCPGAFVREGFCPGRGLLSGGFGPVGLNIQSTRIFVERLEVGTVHMCLSSVSGYRPLINPTPSLGNLLLDITLCSISFRCRRRSGFTGRRCRFLFLLFLGFRLGFGFGIGNLNIFDRSQVALPAQWTVPSASGLCILFPV